MASREAHNLQKQVRFLPPQHVLKNPLVGFFSTCCGGVRCLCDMKVKRSLGWEPHSIFRAERIKILM